MSAAHVEPTEEKASETFSIRLPQDLADFVKSQAKALEHTQNGVFRLAVRRFKQAVENGEKPEATAA